MAGYPGTIAATWQRAGRAGRRAGRSAAVLVASSAPLDQFIVRNPEYFFGAPPEHALINPDNLQVLLDHIKCAAFELPFAVDELFGRAGDVAGRGVDVQQVLSVLADEGFVHKADGAWNWTHESYPADAVSLRSISSDNFVIVDITRESRVIGETDFTSAPSTLHEKAIYILEGQLFQVERFDFEGRKAYVRSVDCDYYTDAIRYAKVTVLEEFATAACGHAAGSHGEVHVVSRVVGFKKIRFYTNENVGSGELDLPEQQMHTTSWWLTIPPAIVTSLSFAADDRRDGISALAYAMRTVAQLLLMCDRQDIGVSVDTDGSAMGSPDRAAAGVSVEPRVFIYDNYPGGIGFSAPLYEMQARLLDATRDLIASCGCERGCPSCVGPVGEIGALGKRVAMALLDRLTGVAFASDADVVPF
jgi:DEAD/DEAH box helicase domain-containing protein